MSLDQQFKRVLISAGRALSVVSITHLRYLGHGKRSLLDFPDRIYDTEARGTVAEVDTHALFLFFTGNKWNVCERDFRDGDDPEALRARASQQGSGRMSESSRSVTR